MQTPLDRRESEAFLLRIRAESTQDDHAHASLPCCKFSKRSTSLYPPLSPGDRNLIAPMTTVSFKITMADKYLPTFAGFDLRPFLYPSRFPFQFKKIDDLASQLPDQSNADEATSKKSD